MKNMRLISFTLASTLINSNAFSESQHNIFCTKINGLETRGGWVLNDRQDNYITASGEWINNEIFQTKKPIDLLKEECSRIFGDTHKSQINVTIKDTHFTQQYPIISAKAPKTLMEKELNLVHYTDVLDYRFILALAYASHYAYRTEEGQDGKDYGRNNYSLSDITSKTGFKLIPGSELKTNQANIHSAAFIDEANKVVIVAYKGTSNSTDFLVDTQLFLANIISQSKITQAIDETLQSYKSIMELVKKQYKNPENYKVVLTGHSLGAFYATIVAINHGLPARVFSSPATHINMSYYSRFFNFYSNLPLHNVINFVRYSDPVNAFSGRHAENRIYFKNTEHYNILKNHSLIGMINDIFEKQEAPYYVELKPTYSDITMKDNSYFGIKKLINFQGYTSPKMLTNLRECDENLKEEDFNLREADDFVIVDLPNQS